MGAIEFHHSFQMVYWLGVLLNTNIRVVEATISRKAECIVIMWCSAVTLDFMNQSEVDVRLCVYRGGKVVVDYDIPLPHLHNKQASSKVLQMIYCVTLRMKHRVVEAIKPGDKLGVFIHNWWHPETTFCTLEANVCVVYDGGGHLLLEVNSDLLSKHASRQLEERFGELVLKDGPGGPFIANI